MLSSIRIHGSVVARHPSFYACIELALDLSARSAKPVYVWENEIPKAGFERGKRIFPKRFSDETMSAWKCNMLKAQKASVRSRAAKA